MHDKRASIKSITEKKEFKMVLGIAAVSKLPTIL